jgi:amidohydrolase
MNETLVDLRRRLHRCAELSGKERETARIVADELSSLAPTRVLEGIGGHGLAAVYDGDGPGPTVLLRCDMDALPIDEGNELAHHSQTRGVAHKCGHDGHMTMMIGVARELRRSRPRTGRIVLLFQPAEEVGRGAEAVLADGRFDELRPDLAVAVHNLPGFPRGAVVLREGTFACASRGLRVSFHGASSHAAEPQHGRSPALAVAQTVQAWSAGPQIATGLLEAAQATIVHAAVGEEAFGTSPAFGRVSATLRGDRDDVVDALERRLLGIARGIASAFELRSESERADDFPATVNDASVVAQLERVAASIGAHVVRPEGPFAWSEDFGHFTRIARGALVGLGAGEQQPPLHHPDYDFPDELLSSGVELLHAYAWSAAVGEESP